MESLKELAFNNPNINFFGKVDYADITTIFKNNDCLIISSKMEAGPYTAIESMAAATPIISTRVGSMEERLQSDYPFFYDGCINDLVDNFNKIISLNSNELIKISNQLRKIYKAKYTSNMIKNKYQMAFKDFNQYCKKT
jgi:glycosyltransferase involved in cell wall biosynthesis